MISIRTSDSQYHVNSTRCQKQTQHVKYAMISSPASVCDQKQNANRNTMIAADMIAQQINMKSEHDSRYVVLVMIRGRI